MINKIQIDDFASPLPKETDGFRNVDGSRPVYTTGAIVGISVFFLAMWSLILMVIMALYGF